MSTIVTTQAELDAALAAGDADVIIKSPAGVWIYLSGSATVTASGSATVTASGSATVRAYDSATVRAYGSATVTAYDSATVRAYDSATVTAYDSATVTAYDSATVTASNYVAVHLHSARARITGGVLIDLTEIDQEDTAEWVAYTGCERDGEDLVVFKAVRDNLRSSFDFMYPIGDEVSDPQWRDDHNCGGGLHFSPTAAQAYEYDDRATRFLECRVSVSEVRTIPGSPAKLKAPRARVIREVTIHGEAIK